MERATHTNGQSIPEGDSIARLRAVAFASGPERWAAFVALARSPDAAALDVLVEACGNADEFVRRAGVEGIGEHVLGRREAALVARLLGDASEYVARSACEAAARLGVTEAREALHALRHSSSSATREVAVRALVSLWHDDDFEPLSRQSREDPSPEVRKEAAWTLQKVASAVHAARLFEAWKADSLPRHRLWACELALLYPHANFEEALRGLTQDPDGHVRAQARRALDSRPASSEP